MNAAQILAALTVKQMINKWGSKASAAFPVECVAKEFEAIAEAAKKAGNDAKDYFEAAIHIRNAFAAAKDKERKPLR